MSDDTVSRWEATSEGFLISGLLLNSPSGSCSLSEVLEPDVDPKYHLSRKAKDGILRRAAKRGRALPDLLRRALEA